LAVPLVYDILLIYAKVVNVAVLNEWAIPLQDNMIVVPCYPTKFGVLATVGNFLDTLVNQFLCFLPS
jgi:hypothetical protein